MEIASGSSSTISFHDVPHTILTSLVFSTPGGIRTHTEMILSHLPSSSWATEAYFELLVGIEPTFKLYKGLVINHYTKGAFFCGGTTNRTLVNSLPMGAILKVRKRNLHTVEVL